MQSFFFLDNLFYLSTGDVEEDAIGKFQNQLGRVLSSRVHTWNCVKIMQKSVYFLFSFFIFIYLVSLY